MLLRFGANTEYARVQWQKLMRWRPLEIRIKARNMKFGITCGGGYAGLDRCRQVSVRPALKATFYGKSPRNWTPSLPSSADNGDKIFRSDLDTARGQLPDQYRNLPMDQLFTPLVNQLVRSQEIAADGRQ